MNPREFQSLASKLATSSVEAEARSATSRAYYAAFLVADEFLHSLGFPSRKNESRHAIVERLLSYSADALLLQAGSDLGRLRQSRNEADYDLQRPEAEMKQTAQTSVPRAARIIQAVDGCGPGPRWTSVQGAIAATLKRISPGGTPP